MQNLEMVMKIASATLFSFYLKSHMVHFNIIGSDFFQYHKLTDEIWKDTIEEFDGISEQIRALDIFAPASLSEFQELSQIEDMTKPLEAKVMLYELLLDNEKLIEALKEANSLAAPHPGLGNFLQGLIDKHEKTGWFLRATVKGK
jgi:starvation-inducible DNA-binding protein